MTASLLSPPQIAAMRAAEAAMAATVLAASGLTCTVTRATARTANRRFGYGETATAVYAGIPCAMKPALGPRNEGQTRYADKVAGRAVIDLLISSAYTVLAGDGIAVSPGDTYEVAGPPQPATPFGTLNLVVCAAVTPLATNP